MAVAGAFWIGLRRGVIPLVLFFDVHGWWLDLLLGIGARRCSSSDSGRAPRARLPMARELDRGSRPPSARWTPPK